VAIQVKFASSSAVILIRIECTDMAEAKPLKLVFVDRIPRRNNQPSFSPNVHRWSPFDAFPSPACPLKFEQSLRIVGENPRSDFLSGTNRAADEQFSGVRILPSSSRAASRCPRGVDPDALDQRIHQRITSR